MVVQDPGKNPQANNGLFSCGLPLESALIYQTKLKNHMSYDDDWPDQTLENRRAMVSKTVRPATLDELKELGEKRFPIVTDPWCVRYNDFLNQHPDASFFRAEIPGNVEIIFCRDSSKGVWFLPGKGMGILQDEGIEIMSKAVAKL